MSAKPIGPDIAKLRKKLNCSIAEARQLVERYGSADAYFRASAPAVEPRLAEPENRVEGTPPMGIFVEVDAVDLPLLRRCRDVLYELGKSTKGADGYAFAESATTIDYFLEQVDTHYLEADQCS